MKRELKHLAPYLSYGLKIKTGVNYIATMGTKSGVDIIGIDRVVLHDEFKPYLRPLYELIDTNIARELNNLSSFIFVYDLRYKTLSIETDNDIELSDMITGIDMLYANHFDVFGLIDAGLAIDINTLTHD